jgi:hypothetical protein
MTDCLLELSSTLVSRHPRFLDSRAVLKAPGIEEDTG